MKCTNLRTIAILGALLVVFASCGGPAVEATAQQTPEPATSPPPAPPQQAAVQQPTVEPVVHAAAPAPGAGSMEGPAEGLVTQQNALGTLISRATAQLEALRSSAATGATPQDNESVARFAELQAQMQQMGQQLEAMDQAALSEADLSGYEERILTAIGELKATRSAGQSETATPVENVSQTLFQMLGVLEQAGQIKTQFAQLGSTENPRSTADGTTPPGSAGGSQPAMGAQPADLAQPRLFGSAGAQPRARAVTRGYAAVMLEAMVAYPGRLAVRVNGLLVGSYDSSIKLNDAAMDALLQPGAVNTVHLSFDRYTKDDYLRPSWAALSVRTAGSEEWIRIYSFSTAEDRLEDSFELPYVGN